MKIQALAQAYTHEKKGGVSMSNYNLIGRYNTLMNVVRNRMTTRAFDPNCIAPKELHELILEAARHGTSGANA